MARFLISVWPSVGHVYPAIAIGRALVEQGHDVSFHTRPLFARHLETLGMDVIPLTTMPGMTEHGISLRDEPAGSWAMKKAFQQRFIAPLPELVRIVRDAAEACRPDVIINDYVSFAPLIVGELTDTPVATLTMTAFSWPGEDFAPFGSGLPPAHDAATRARYATLRANGEAFFADVVDAFNAARAAHGLPARPSPLPAATLSQYLQLVLSIPALDYERDDLPPQVHYTGLCAWDPPAPPDPDTAAWLAELAADRPLVLVAASSIFTRSAGLIDAALTGLADLDVGVLATLPFDHSLHSTPLPPHIRLARFVPHAQVLPRASAVVAHGGFGGVSKALGHGLPLVVVPYAGDQPEVAQRVVAAGAGLRLDPAALTPAALRAAVREALGDDSYRRRARDVATALAQWNGPREAATLLSRLAATRRPVLQASAAVGLDA